MIERTKLDLRSLVGVQFLAPRVHAEHIIDGEDVNVLDALGGELVVSLNVPWNLLRRERRLISCCSLVSARSLAQLTVSEQTGEKAAGTRTITLFPCTLLKLSFWSGALILTSTSGTGAPTVIWLAEASVANAEWAAAVVPLSAEVRMDAIFALLG